MNKQIENLMRVLGCTEEEARQIVEDDKRIEKGEKLFELSAEAEKVSKQARQVDRKPAVYKLDNTEGKRSKKANSDKQALIQILSNALNAEIEIINPEREFTFIYNDKKYKVTLSQPRS